MKKQNLIFIFIIITILSCNFLLKNKSFNYHEKTDTTENFSPILSNGIDIADEWYRTYGSQGDDIAYDVAISSTTGIIFVAGSQTWYGDISGWQVWFCDSNGYWFSGSGMFNQYQDMHPYAAESDSLGNVIIGGEYFQELNGLYYMELWKYNSTGGLLWSRRWGGSVDAKCYGLTVDLSDNIYMVGEIQNSSTGTPDMCLVKYNSSGVLEWNRTWGGIATDKAYDVAVDPSGNIYLAGNTYSYGLGGPDMCLVMYNSTGDFQWSKTWGGTDRDYCTSIALDSTGNIYMAGHSTSFLSGFPTYPDICLVKLNGSGVYQWHQTWGSGIGVDKCFDMEIDLTGDIYLAGETNSYNTRGADMCLIKYNSSGERQWNCTWGGDYFESCYGITLDSSGNLYLAGYTQSYGYGGSDMCLVKFSSNPKITILSPQNSEYFGVEAPNFEFSVFEPDLEYTWYTIDEGVTNINCSLTGQIDQTEWDQKQDGGVTIRFYAEDTQDNEAFSEVYIQKDTIPPTISIILPNSEARYPTLPPIFNIYVGDDHILNSTWYTVDNGLNNITIEGISLEDNNYLWDQISNSIWNGVPNGEVTITFYAKDAAGNIASESVIVHKGRASEQISGYNLILFLGILGVMSVIALRKIRKFLK